MRRITISLFIALMAVIGTNAFAASTVQVGAPIDLLTTFNTISDGDTIELTTSGGAYTWSSKISNLTKSFTLRAATGLLEKPTVTLPNGLFIATINNAVVISVTLLGIDFSGNGGAATGLSLPKSAAAGNFNMTISDCIFRGFAANTNFFAYSLTGTGWNTALKWYGTLSVSNSKFLSPFTTIANYSSTYGGASTTSFTNCYIEGGTGTVMGSGAGNANNTISYTVDHCTFVNAGGATGTEFNVKNGGTSTTIVKNSIFANNPGGVATKVIAVGTNPGNVNNANNGVYYSGTVPLIGIKYPTALLGNYLTTNPELDTDGFALATAYLTGPTDGKPRGFYNHSTSPWISLSKAGLAALGYNGVGPDAVAQSFKVAGTNLGANIVITPPSNFEISQDGTAFSTSPISLTPASKTIASTTIYVRMVASLPANNYTDTLTITSAGAVTKSLQLSGTVTLPTITSDTYDITQFDYFTGLGPSAYQFILLNATNLQANLTITAPANFELSLNTATNFSADPIVVTPDELGSIVDKKLYVRMIVGLTPNIYTGNLTLSSTGAVTKNVSVIGGVSNKPTMAISNYYGLNYVLGNGPSEPQKIVIEGGGLTDDIHISLPTNSNFEITLDKISLFSQNLTLTQTNGIVSFIPIYVRLKAGLGINNYSDVMTLTSNGSNSISAVLDGNVTSSANPAPQKAKVFEGGVLKMTGKETNQNREETKKVTVLKVIVR